MVDKKIILAIILIVIVATAVYSNVIGGRFFWDDGFLVRDNSSIRSFSSIPTFFTANLAAEVGQKTNYYRPLQMVSYTLDHALFMLDARGYHCTNIFLHILTALGIYWLVNILYKDSLLSLFAGLLFVVHPINTEAVSYIAGRADILAGLFTLLSFILYAKHLHSGNLRTYLMMVLSYACALLSRENCLVFPLLLLLYHYAFQKRFAVKPFLSVLCVTFSYLFLRLALLKSSVIAVALGAALTQRMCGFFAAITGYTKLLLFPLGLHMEYGHGNFSLTDPAVLAGIAIALASSTYVFLKRRDDSVVFFSISWFFIALLPYSNLYPINAYMAEHWLYIPSIGFFLIMAKFMSRIWRRNAFYAAGVIGVLVFYSCVTVNQNGYWKDPVAFYERNLRYTPHNAKIYYNLGNEYSALGNTTKAISSYTKAIAFKPDYAEAYQNLADIYRDTGKPAEAVLLFKKAIKISPRNASLYNNLGIAYGAMGNNEEALKSFEQAIAIDPRHAKAYCNIGVVYRSVGRVEEAMALFEKAIVIDPHCVEAYYNLASLEYQKGRYGSAIAQYDKITELGFFDPALSKDLKPYRKSR